MNTTSDPADLNRMAWRWILQLFLLKLAQHGFTWWLSKKLKAAADGR
jgi:hypothetical protein